MSALPRNRVYRRLFAAQVVALTGTGLATVALSLLAYDLAGPRASAVLGTALAIKMVAYVTVAPAVGALAGRIPPRALMAGADAIRAGTALALPFVTELWQVYALILLLQAASAAFTPTFQATVPRVLPDERDYTRALSLSRLAYDLESLLSPALAAALLTVVPYPWLFAGTTAGFLGSAALVVTTALPRPGQAADAGSPGTPASAPPGPYARAAGGARLFLAAPPLRALLALHLAVAAAGALVFADTVVLVRDHFQRPAEALSLALGAYGAGSVAAALLLPRLLGRRGDRTVMLGAAAALPALLAGAAALAASAPGAGTWAAVLAAWAGLGAACSAVLTPAGRVIRRSAAEPELPAAFAAQFSLSHACWLLTYPLAGGLGATAGLPAAAAVLAVLALAAVGVAARTWPRQERVAHAVRLARPQPLGNGRSYGRS
ncbi:MFS transporter [Streptomyces sp. NPDC048604]|uniref:MFS transporter n=1 Tax=Streptomyces sp. NPDC048604 TaxID=3365578 RepID=UPI00371ED474